MPTFYWSRYLRPQEAIVSPYDYHGLHAAGLREDHERLDWYPPEPRGARIRVRNHTCTCSDVILEFLYGGRRGVHPADGSRPRPPGDAGDGVVALRGGGACLEALAERERLVTDRSDTGCPSRPSAWPVAGRWAAT